MRVTIVDLDWYNNLSFVPNPTCMKISSYYKQLGYSVNFALKDFEIMLSYDIIYLVREKLTGKIPSCINIRDARVRLVGKAFRFYSNYVRELDDAILACRPDYMLYDLPLSNREANNCYVQFYGNNGRLPMIQDYHSAYEKAKDIVVIDENFWSKNIEDVRYCCEILKKERNIVFSKPISLKILAKETKKRKFLLGLKLKQMYSCTFVSDFEESDNTEVMEFIKEFRETFPHHVVKPIEFKIWRPGYEDIDNIQYGLELAKTAKMMEVPIILKAPEREEAALWSYYEDLEAWSRNDFRTSYVDYVAGIQSRISKLEKIVVLEHEIHWSMVPMQNLADICRRRWKIVRDYGFLAWGDKTTEYVDLSKTLRIKGEQ